MTMAQALNRALADALEADPSVLVFGEDVGPLGGVFRITDGLTARFGEDRCFDTPLAEAGIVGSAVGLAMNGMRPVVEMQFDAFAYPAFEQIVDHVAKMGNRTRGAVRLPLVIRIPYAGGIGGVEHHSDSSEAYYAHTPGLTVVTPATPQDAYGLLRAAIAHPDPVIFLEPKKLYWTSGAVDTTAPLPEIGRAQVIRDGTDATIIAYGPSVPVALAAADAAAGGGAQPPGRRRAQHRAVRRRDRHRQAVRSTGRAVVVAEAPGFASVASEIAARVSERCFHYLEAPVLRVTGFDTPFAPPKLEEYYLPSVDRLLDAVDRLQWDDAEDGTRRMTAQVFTASRPRRGPDRGGPGSLAGEVGDDIVVDQPIAEVETAKSVVEVPSPYGGTVEALHGEEGEDLRVGAPLIEVDEGGGTARPRPSPSRQPSAPATCSSATVRPRPGTPAAAVVPRSSARPPACRAAACHAPVGARPARRVIPR